MHNTNNSNNMRKSEEGSRRLVMAASDGSRGLNNSNGGLPNVLRGLVVEKITSRRLVEDKLRTRRLVEACGGEGFENERREGKRIRARSVKMS